MSLINVLRQKLYTAPEFGSLCVVKLGLNATVWIKYAFLC